MSAGDTLHAKTQPSCPNPRFGLAGWPVSHSVSPAMHMAAFAALGLPWRYELLPTPPQELEDLLRGLRARGFYGLNVTVPHKQRVIPYLDELSATAMAIGAVNTIAIRGGQLAGHNTDAAGFLAALGEAGCEVNGKRALVLGAGGAARSVVYALAQAGCSVLIHNRTPAHAAGLARQMRNHAGGALVSAVPDGESLHRLQFDDIDFLVNATPAGMHPAVESTPWPAHLPLPPHWTVNDLVYSPPETRLLARARAAGARTIGGLAMLVHQGALALQIWTGQPAPLEVMRAAAHQAAAARPLL